MKIVPGRALPRAIRSLFPHLDIAKKTEKVGIVSSDMPQLINPEIQILTIG